MRAPRQLPRSCTLLPLVLLVLLVLGTSTGCDTSGGLPAGAGGSGETGSVSVLFTDAPDDEFDAVNITTTKIELHGARGVATVFEGHETFDLMALRSVNELFSVADDVRAGRYVRIRIWVEQVAVVFPDGTSEEAAVGEYIDVLPRGGVDVRRGRMTIVQIDVDVEKSLVVATDGGVRRCHFRPVVVARILRELFDGRVTRLHGVVREIDADAGRFELCQMRRPLAWIRDPIHDRWHHAEMAQPASFEARDEDGDGAPDVDERHHPRFRCVAVTLTDSASIFDEQAEPVGLGDVEEGQRATVIGRIRPSAERRLQLVAEIVLLGAPGTYELRLGTVVSEYDELLEQFVLELLSGHGDLLVQLSEHTRIYQRDGSPLVPDVIEPGLRAAATGVLFLSSEEPATLQTVILILDLDGDERAPLRGEITAIDGCGEEDARCVVSVQPEEGDAEEVCVFPRTLILLIDADGQASHESDASELEPGDRVDVYGRPGDACFGAGLVVAFPAGDDPAPEPDPVPPSAP